MHILQSVLYMMSLYVSGLWLLSDINKCSNLDGRTVLAEREKA